MAARVVPLGAYVPFGQPLAPNGAQATWIVRENQDGLDEELYWSDTQIVWSAGQRLLRSFNASTPVKQALWTSFTTAAFPAELCVLHEGGLDLHTERGLGYPIAVSFVPTAIHPIPGGLILQDAGGALYSLFHPLAEARPVASSEKNSSLCHGRICFSTTSVPYVLFHDAGQLVLAHLAKHEDLETQKTYEAACALSNAAESTAPLVELTINPLLRVPCPNAPKEIFLLEQQQTTDAVAMICIQSGAQLTVIALPPSPTSATPPAVLFSVPALSAAPVRWQRRVAVLVLSPPASPASKTPSLTLLTHANASLGLILPPSLPIAQLTRLANAAGSRLSLVSEQSVQRVELRQVFSCGLACSVAELLEQLLPLQVAGALLAITATIAASDSQPDAEWRHLSSVLSAALVSTPQLPTAPANDWEFLLQSAAHTSPLNVAATRHLTPVSSSHHSSLPPPPQSALPAPVAAAVRDQAAQLIGALHTLFETLKLDTRRSAALATLGGFVAPLATANGMPVHAQLIARDLALRLPSSATPAIQAPALPQPFYLHSWLISCLTPNAPLSPIPSPLPNSLRVFLRLYCLLSGRDDGPLRLASHAPSQPSQPPAARVINAMAEENLTLAYLDTLPTGLSLPLREVLYVVRPAPPPTWSAAAHDLISRKDLRDSPLPPHTPLPAAVVQATVGEEENNKNGILPFHPVSVLRFRADARLSELHTLLSSAKTLDVVTKSGSEGDLQEQQIALIFKAQRCMAQCVGRGALVLCSTEHAVGAAQTPLTIALDCPALVLSGRVRGTGSPVTLDPAVTAADLTHWAEFHNGVAAALRLSPDLEGVSAAWIAYQRPLPEPSPTHGGLLLGLGLHGHLRALVTSQVACSPLVYDYLRGHELTSVGLMIGLAASHRGTMHGAVLKMLCIHLPSFHPPASAELEALKDMPHVQAAALVGLGLLCEGSANRRLTEVLLDEIGKRPPDERRFTRESHTMAAGCALGLVCLGREASPGLADLRLFDRLCGYLEGTAKKSTTGNPPRSNLLLESNEGNADTTAPAAMCALAFMYMHSNNNAAAAPLAMPASFPVLEAIRPDHLILRVICRYLILWDSVQPSRTWIDSLLPPFLAQPTPAPPPIDTCLPRDEQLHVLARLYIRTGGLLAVAFRFAGTQHPQATALLLAELSSAMQFKPKDSEPKMIRHALESSMALTAVAAAIVLSGTGDLRLLRLLRALHRRKSQHLSYGHQMLTHMAIGFLFLGGGRLAFATTKSALAALLLSVYPALPSSPSDNRHHLQAFRHMYVLAAEARCVTCRDVDSQELCVMPLCVSLVRHFLPATEALSLSAPCLLPPWSAIKSLRLDTPRYFARDLEGAALDALRRTLVIPVRRRPGYLPHAMDPRGTLSLLSHPIPRVRFSSAGLARLQRQSSVLKSFAADPALHAFARHFCSEQDDTDLAAYGNRLLHECIVGERLDALASFLALRQLLLHLANERSSVAVLSLQVALHFYSQPALLSSLYAREQRQPLLDATFVANAKARVNAFFAQKGFIGGSQSATTLKSYLQTGEVPGVAYGSFLSWHSLPLPQSRINISSSLPVVCKTLGLSVPAAVLLMSALK